MRKFIQIKENIFFLLLGYRMTISDFKKVYTEINPNANIFNYENDAERRILEFDFRIFFNKYF